MGQAVIWLDFSSFPTVFKVSGHAKRLCHIDNKQISRPHGFSQIQPSPTRADFADSYGSHPRTPFHTAAYEMRIVAPGSLRLYRILCSLRCRSADGSGVQQRWFGSIFFRMTSPTGTILCMIAKCTLPKSRCRFQYSSDFAVLYRYGRKFPRSSNRSGSCSYFRKYIRFNVFVILHNHMFVFMFILHKY